MRWHSPSFRTREAGFGGEEGRASVKSLHSPNGRAPDNAIPARKGLRVSSSHGTGDADPQERRGGGWAFRAPRSDAAWNRQYVAKLMKWLVETANLERARAAGVELPDYFSARREQVSRIIGPRSTHTRLVPREPSRRARRHTGRRAAYRRSAECTEELFGVGGRSALHACNEAARLRTPARPFDRRCPAAREWAERQSTEGGTRTDGPHQTPCVAA